MIYKMKITIVSGSQRRNSQSLKVANFLKNSLSTDFHDVEAEILNLESNPLPLWDDNFSNRSGEWASKWTPVSQALVSSHGFVFVIPEWAGMAPAGIRNLFQLCGNKELGHKPGLLVSVSAASNGAYPIAEMRATSTKNNHMVYIPDHIILRNVESVLNDTDASTENDISIRLRISYSLRVLHEYARALTSVRQSGTISYKNYAYGM